MNALKRLQTLSDSSKYYSSVLAGLKQVDGFGWKNVVIKNLIGIPDVEELWNEYHCMEIARKKTLTLVLDELIKECNITTVPNAYSIKMRLIKLSIKELAELNLVPSSNAVVYGLLSHLEPFPFDHGEIPVNLNNLSIKNIRDIIKRQYFSWKFKTSKEDIKVLWFKLKISFSEFQSMRNLARNVGIVESLPLISNIAEKIYHVNQIPLNIPLLINFQEDLAGLNWTHFPQHCPKLLTHSYQYIVFLITSLQRMHFTNTQIQEALPFLHLHFYNILNRLNFILTHPDIAKYRNEDKFLQLLSYESGKLNYCFAFRKDCFSELIQFVETKRKNRGLGMHINSILYNISQFFPTESSSICRDEIKRHRNWKYVSEQEILDNLSFLKNNGFKGSEVAESITIIFYPRRLVENTLKEIKAKETVLSRCGFHNGCVSERTNFFSAGTKSENKLLQLCLYYLEKNA